MQGVTVSEVDGVAERMEMIAVRQNRVRIVSDNAERDVELT